MTKKHAKLPHDPSNVEPIYPCLDYIVWDNMGYSLLLRPVNVIDTVKSTY